MALCVKLSPKLIVMKKIIVIVLVCFEFMVCKSQTVPAAAALEGKDKTLQERYLLMKTKSETYQDLKVIKEGILDGVWKITNDTLNKRELQLKEANDKILSIKNEMNTARAELKSKEDSMESIVFASTHINVLGIDLSKGFFLTFATLVGVALFAIIAFLLVRIKVMRVFVKESEVIVASTTSEFEDYKRKMFDMQTKLARELQTERNKLNELKESRRTL